MAKGVYTYQHEKIRDVPNETVEIVDGNDGYAYAMNAAGDAVDWWPDGGGVFRFMLAVWGMSPAGFFRSRRMVW